MLKGKVAIVTGAGQGVGRGIALALAGEGAAVAVIGRTLAKCERTVEEIAAAGGKTFALACDVSKREVVDGVVAEVVTALGPVDILVNNAHTSNPLVPMMEVSEKDMAIAFKGFHGAFHFMQACFPYLKERQGRVINLGSVAGIRGDEGFAAYAASKEAVRAMSRVASRELETPFSVFNEGILTPNEAFFVRYHLSNLPTVIDPATFRLSIGGHVEKPLELSLAALKKDFPVHEVVAVNQCSGNSRGFSEPRVGGGQLGNGAMGNARWRGVALKDLLDRSGVRAGARQVTFNGLDNPPIDTIPDFVKALDLDHALDGEVMVAFAMNGKDLPFLNGYPLRRCCQSNRNLSPNRGVFAR